MAGNSHDVIGLYADEALSVLEGSGIKVVCLSTAPKENPAGQLRVIRQRHRDQDLMELVLSEHPIIWKGGGNSGVQNY